MSCIDKLLSKKATEDHKIFSNKSGAGVSIFSISPENVTPCFPIAFLRDLNICSYEYHVQSDKLFKKWKRH